MTVHAQSVIPTWVNDYYPEFYASLTDKENWSYTLTLVFTHPTVPPDPLIPDTIVPGINLYLPLFNTLKDKLVLWKDGNYQSIVAEICPLIAGVYGLAVTFNANENLETGEKSVDQLLEGTDAFTLFGINGFAQATLDRPVEYYNDITEGGTSALLSTDISTVSGATTADIAAAEAAKPDLYASLRTLGSRATFETPTGTAPDSEQKKQKVFAEMHYSNIYRTFKVGMPDPTAN